MSISNVSSIFSASIIQSVTQPSSQPAATSDPGGVSSSENVSISKPGQLFSELSSLAQSDPDKFKSVTADIAKQLKEEASSATGSTADHLNKLADRFSAASQSGSVSDLAPPNAGQAQGHHHGHGGHHHGQGGGGGAPGAGSEGSVAETVQSIISKALGEVSASA